MKKLLILAVLVLGLWASPAMATIVTDGFGQGQWGYWTLDDGTVLEMPSGFPIYFGGEWKGQELMIHKSVRYLSLSFNYGTPADNIQADYSDFLYVQLISSQHNYAPVVDKFVWSPADGSTSGSFNMTFDLSSFISGAATHNDYIEEGAELLIMFTNPSQGYWLMDSGLYISNIVLSASSSNPVPVPAAVWLLGTGVAGVAALRRKFK